MCLILAAALLPGINCSKKSPSSVDQRSVPHQERWGIYALDLASEDIELITAVARL